MSRWRKSIGRLLVVLWSAASCACAASGEEASRLHPVDVAEFIVNADEGVTLRFSVSLEGCDPGMPYVVRDYAGAEEYRGVVKCSRDLTTVELPTKFHRGYHEINFAETGSTYGVVALDRLSEPVSGFFGIDTALSYLESSPGNRSQFVAQLKRLGIGAVRDRINWNELHPSQGEWEGRSGHQFDSLRQLYAGAKIKVLDVLHDLPARPGNYFPASAADVASLSQIAGHWGKVWNGVEISNEPDHNQLYDSLSPGAQRTYQRQYADYASRVSKTLSVEFPGVPTVGGAFAYALAAGKADSSGFARSVAAAGLLASVDAISFHTYDDPIALQRDIDSFRDWLRRSGSPNMPLWITESGWSWRRGPGRPPLDQDQASALQIAAKALVAYAMGVQRYYAFVYPYYEEKNKNFGMTGRDRTPLRSLAAYEQVAKTLSGAQPLTTLGDAWSGNGLTGLFKTPSGNVMVIYAGRAQSNSACVEMPFKPIRVEGIDGRLLGADKTVCVEDGLVYVWVDGNDVPDARAVVDALARRSR